MEIISTPLLGITVLDLSTVLAGPAVGMFLAEMGAKVIKVEQPILGDVTRSWISKNETCDDGISAYFSCVNWGKKSIALSFTDAVDRIILDELIKKSDIILCNLKPGDDMKFGLTPDDIEKINPSVIYGRISGYGANDTRVGYDAIIQAESGLMFMNGNSTETIHKMPIAFVDILAAHQLKEGLLLALLQQKNNPKSILVEVSLLDAAISTLANQATNWLKNKIDPQPIGSEHPNIAPYGTMFNTADYKSLVLAVGTDKQFNALCSILKLGENDLFKTNADRVFNRSVLNMILKASIFRFKASELLQILHQHQIPSGIVQSVGEVLDSDFASRLLMDVELIRGVRTAAFSHSQIQLTPPPKLDEHRDEILLDINQLP